jgi:hypothetical protein
MLGDCNFWHNPRRRADRKATFPAALDGYKASLAIRDGLAQSDPGYAGWQRDLAQSHGRMGIVEARQGAESITGGSGHHCAAQNPSAG